jgi:hypothetical protein
VGVSYIDIKDDFQDSNKRKGTKNKNMGYLPRVLFFNAFELGAENCESSNNERGIRIHYRNKGMNTIQLRF